MWIVSKHLIYDIYEEKSVKAIIFRYFNEQWHHTISDFKKGVEGFKCFTHRGRLWAETFVSLHFPSKKTRKMLSGVWIIIFILNKWHIDLSLITAVIYHIAACNVTMIKILNLEDESCTQNRKLPVRPFHMILLRGHLAWHFCSYTYH